MQTTFSHTRPFLSPAVKTLGVAGLSLLASGAIASLPWSDEQLDGGQTLGSLLIGTAGALTVEGMAAPAYSSGRSASRGTRPETETLPTF